MARTAEMKLIELMVLKDDIQSVIEYIGKKGSFQFQTTRIDSSKNPENSENSNLLDLDSQFFDKLHKIQCWLGLPEENSDMSSFTSPKDEDRTEATKLFCAYDELSEKINVANENYSKISEAYKEALSFANLQVSYSELEHLSFISMKIGKIDSNSFEELKENLEGIAAVIPLGEDKSRILTASSKKNRYAMDTELKKAGFVEIEIPSDFKGIPEDALDGLRKQKTDAKKECDELETEKANFSETHKEIIYRLSGNFSIGMQISQIEKTLESTESVFRITGWIPANECDSYMKDLDNITESRIAIRKYDPFEIPSVISGKEQVPVKLNHGKFIKSFERMIFSYGSPIYGTIDPTPFVAIFFTLLFGIMFGDCGQGLVIFLTGLLMKFNVIKVGNWNKFSRIFMAVGISSSIMGLLTGEFFSTETVLEPFSLWITGLFGEPRHPIIKMMPSSDPNSIKTMFTVFGVAVAVGFVINTIGLIINIVNNMIRKRWSEALFGKNGLSGALFFWYVVVLVLRIVILKHSVEFYDWIVIGITMFFAAFAEPFERKMNGEKTLFENGFGTYLISGIVEVIEVISGYLSNTVSFVRVGAFALSHAVLNYVVLILTELVGGGIGSVLVLIIGNAVIIVLEGMIVAIQVIRLQYYEFFSKFFHETGREFKPFKFESK